MKRVNKEKNIRQIRTWAMVGCIALTLLLAGMALHYYFLSGESLEALKVEENRLDQLNKKIQDTKDSITRLRKEPQAWSDRERPEQLRRNFFDAQGRGLRWLDLNRRWREWNG